MYIGKFGKIFETEPGFNIDIPLSIVNNESSSKLRYCKFYHPAQIERITHKYN